MTDEEIRKQQVLDLTSEIAKAADDGVGPSARDIVAAAKAIQRIVSPSALDESVGLAIRMSPWVPGADRVELPDGTLVKGVKAVEVIDRHGEQRVARIEIVGITVLGQPEVTGAP